MVFKELTCSGAGRLGINDNDSTATHNELAGRSTAGAHPAAAVTWVRNGGSFVPAADATTQAALERLNGELTDEVVGNGGDQATANKLGRVPNLCFAFLTGGPGAYAQPRIVAGVHTAAEYHFEVTADWVYRIMAF